jgi:integrase
VAFDVLFYTGLRRGDAVKVGRQRVRDGTITIETEKTGELVSIRIHPDLAASLTAGPTGDLAFIIPKSPLETGFETCAVRPTVRARHMVCARR